MTELYPIEAGDQVGIYRVLGSYPQGGYRAVDLVDGTRIHLEISPSEDWRDRSIQLLRAASIVGSLEHPGIARIHGRGVLPDRCPWVASELAEGVPLCELLSRRQLAVDETIAMVRDLAEIVAHAHARRVIHGAIRPHLIVFRTGERAFPLQLGGWGDLRSHGISDASKPMLSAYTAPELGHGIADGRADVYSIGALAYRALTGRHPGMISSELVANLPVNVSTLVVGMLAIDPAQRMTAIEVICEATKLCGDRVHGRPRFGRPRWTPPPLPDSERVANITDFAAARRARS
jgi:serine/threonine protein kinase